jgi:hypothetical protein
VKNKMVEINKKSRLALPNTKVHIGTGSARGSVEVQHGKGRIRVYDTKTAIRLGFVKSTKRKVNRVRNSNGLLGNFIKGTPKFRMPKL